MEREFNQTMLMRGSGSPIKHTKSFTTNSTELSPPLKSARNCKKQITRNTKARGITPSIMLMHESSINHHRVSKALNELCMQDFSLLSSVNHQIESRPFWSRESNKDKDKDEDFWNDYLECEMECDLDLEYEMDCNPDCNPECNLECNLECNPKCKEFIPYGFSFIK